MTRFTPATPRGPDTPKTAKPRRAIEKPKTQVGVKAIRYPFQTVDKAAGKYTAKELCVQLCISTGEWVTIQEQVSEVGVRETDSRLKWKETSKLSNRAI